MTQRPMRPQARRLPAADCRPILDKAEYGVLSTIWPDGLPYGVPLSFAVLGGAIYFHCAREGRKIDNIRRNGQVSFAVVGETRPVYAKNFTTWYESVIISGTIAEVTDGREKFDALYALAAKYLPEHLDKADQDITISLAKTAVYALRPGTVSGKAKREPERQ